ncbi:MAG: undecaprenyldiphospho-muramoylpentapeptide beta-N-acetylglucosaminyltransferase [Porticoccaceae bacterium]|nr:undecaprenyldiphospho-muramoylpentapeptide beta-N-acetylglucosaminyltransferase [Pseudomonadales bacterium]
MAGGTGGHVFPALSVARELRQRGVGVVWLGTRAGIESELVPAEDIPLHYIRVEGLRGAGMNRWLRAPVLLVKAVWQALKIIRAERPDMVLGLGGFASGPGGVAARILRKPLVIHEQNAVPGTTNKLLAKMATRILVAFPNAIAGAEYCGNPVRAEIAQLPEPNHHVAAADRQLRLLVLGGSLGAQAINECLPEALTQLPEDLCPQVRHQCGRQHEQQTLEAYRRANVAARVEPFISDMAEAYGWADLVLCRSGALTVSELAVAGVGSILVPYPHAIDDHQTANARWLANVGAAVLLPQNEMTSDRLAEVLQQWLSNRSQLRSMAVRARKQAKTDAATVVADACEEVCHGG